MDFRRCGFDGHLREWITLQQYIGDYRLDTLRLCKNGLDRLEINCSPGCAFARLRLEWLSDCSHGNEHERIGSFPRIFQSADGGTEPPARPGHFHSQGSLDSRLADRDARRGKSAGDVVRNVS